MSGRNAERNGYWFWGLLALFILVPEVLAALSRQLRSDIPWPTISNLIGRNLERHHHWVALVVMGTIVLVAYHAATYKPTREGHALREPPQEVEEWSWGGWYIVCVAVVTAAAGFVAASAGGSKDTVGFAIYGTVALGALVPSLLAYFNAKLIDVPTLFATISYLQRRAHWVAAVFVALLVVLLFHLALYPWPNYTFGGP